MLQIVNLFLVIAGVIASGIGIAWHRSAPASFVMLAIGIGLIAIAYMSDKRRQTHAEATRRADVANRIAGFTKAPWGAHQSLKIRGRFWASTLLFVMMLLGGWGIYAGLAGSRTHADLVSSGVLLLAIALILLPRELVGLGRPALELDGRGLTTPVDGRISWRDVSGIHLLRVTVRGGTSYRLMFRVKDYGRVVTHIHWSERMLAVFHLGALARGVVSAPLRDRREKPETVYAVARFLWKQATGNDYEWNPGMSEGFNQALRRTNALAARLQEPDAIKRALRESPENVLTDFGALDTDLALMSRERKRQLAKLNLAAAFFFVLMLLGMAWPWLKPLMNR